MNPTTTVILHFIGPHNAATVHQMLKSKMYRWFHTNFPTPVHIVLALHIHIELLVLDAVAKRGHFNDSTDVEHLMGHKVAGYQSYNYLLYILWYLA